MEGRVTEGRVSSMRRRQNLLKISLKADQAIVHPAKVGKEVTYSTGNHLSVITQMYGSVWPRVIPFCLTNTISTALIWYIDKRYLSIDLSINPMGHKYLATLLSFLVIARLRIIYGSSIRAREQISVVTQNAHDLVETATALTSHNKSMEAMKWRRLIALGAIEFLRDCMDALSYNSALSNEWTKEEAVLRKVMFRKPTMTALAMKEKIISHRTCPEFIIARPQSEARLLSYVDKCQNAFYKIDALVNTPFPFPLVQMARTILFFWLYTLPFALIQHTASPFPLWGLCMIIFLLTYGFIGLEFVCIEMSDPFGDDANDFDQVNLARITFEDIYLTVFRYDGHEGEVSKVRRRADDLLDESLFFRTRSSVM